MKETMDLVESRREARLRSAVRRLGYSLVKSRHKYTRGTFGVIDPYRNAWIAYIGSDGYGMTLDDIEEWVSAPSGEQ